MMKAKLLLTALLTGACATSAMAAHDDFNRNALGMNWIIPDGSEYITADTLQGASLSLAYDTKSKNDATASALVILGGPDLEYGAVASGDIATGNNAFVKLQAASGDGMFTNGAFYTGNNGGGDYFALNAEVPSPARITLSFCGTVATMKIKSSAGYQTYNYDYGTNYGTGGGLGTYGTVSLDHYKSSPGGCAVDSKGTWIKKGSGARLHDMTK